MSQMHSIVTVSGRNKEALKQSQSQAIVFTELALGDGDRYPSGGETSMENEVFRGQITATGVEEVTPNAMWFDIYVPASVNTFFVQELGLFDEDGVLFALTRWPSPIPKFGPDSSALGDETFRIVVVFADVENIVVNVSPVAGITADTLPQHLPFATEAEASDTATLGKIIQVKQAHELFALHHDETITGDNTSESPLSVREAGQEPGIVTLEEIDNRFMALIRNNLVYPEIQTADNRFTITDNADGTLSIDAAQTWLWRGMIQFSSDNFTSAERTVTTVANKTYLWYWHAPGTGNATPEATYPNGRFELKDMDGLVETEDQYNAGRDQLLIARVITDSSNIATIDELANISKISLSASLTGIFVLNEGANGSNAIFKLTANLSRKPTIKTFTRMSSIYQNSGDRDYEVGPYDARSNGYHLNYYGYFTSNRYIFGASVMDDYVQNLATDNIDIIYYVCLGD